ncbi:hypothetical protein ACFPMF_13135 [Larkinella bovis]|uniref:Secretion system C-terminal sorting domain-containing protein n=1 Tax=Larkinella bovis TaxID=683041 RepID=A0ABW0IA89_9BACT
MKTILKTLLVALTLTFVGFTTAEAGQPIGRPKKAASFQSVMYLTAEGKIQVSLNKEVGGAVVVRLKNSKNADLYVQHVGKRQHAVRMRFDVGALPDGVYQVEISNGLEKTTQTVTLITQTPTEPARLVAIN